MSGTTITWTSGDLFSNRLLAGDRIFLATSGCSNGGTDYCTVASVIDSKHISTVESQSVASAQIFKVQNAGLKIWKNNGNGLSASTARDTISPAAEGPATPPMLNSIVAHRIHSLWRLIETAPRVWLRFQHGFVNFQTEAGLKAHMYSFRPQVKLGISLTTT